MLVVVVVASGSVIVSTLPDCVRVDTEIDVTVGPSVAMLVGSVIVETLQTVSKWKSQCFH